MSLRASKAFYCQSDFFNRYVYLSAYSHLYSPDPRISVSNESHKFYRIFYYKTLHFILLQANFCINSHYTSNITVSSLHLWSPRITRVIFIILNKFKLPFEACRFSRPLFQVHSKNIWLKLSKWLKGLFCLISARKTRWPKSLHK